MTSVSENDNKLTKNFSCCFNQMSINVFTRDSEASPQINVPIQSKCNVLHINHTQSVLDMKMVYACKNIIKYIDTVTVIF